MATFFAVDTETEARVPAPRGLHWIRLLDMSLLTGDVESAAAWLVEVAQRPDQPPTLATHVNVHNYYLFDHDQALRAVIKRDCTLFFDGIGMKLGFAAQGTGWVPDLNGTDMFPLVMARLSLLQVPVYFLGGPGPALERAVDRTRETYPKLQLVGYHPGYFEEDEDSRVVEDINRSGARVLLNGRGCPLQERFAVRQRLNLRLPLVWNVGGLLDFVSGDKPRAPELMRRIRLEWAYRVGREPLRMWRRVAIEPPWFMQHVLRGGPKR